MKCTLREALTLFEILVTFTKLNGQNRDMKCTLIENLIPFEPEQNNSNAVTVWDCTDKSWKTIRLDSVIDWRIT